MLTLDDEWELSNCQSSNVLIISSNKYDQSPIDPPVLFCFFTECVIYTKLNKSFVFIKS